MKLLKFFGIILSFILTVVFFIFVIGFSTIFFTKSVLTEERISDYIEKIDVFEMNANDVFPDTYNKDETLKDAISSKLESSGIPKNFTVKILEGKELTNFVSHNLISYYNYCILDKEKTVIKIDDIKSIVSINMIENYSNKSLTTRQKNEFNNFLDSTVTFLNEEIPDKEEVVVLDSKTKDIINFIYSDKLKTYSLIFIGVVFLLIALFRWSLYKPMMWVSIPIMLWGIIISVIALLQNVIIKRYATSFGAIESIVIKGIDIVFKDVLKMGLIMIGGSILLIIIYSILKKIFYKEEEFDFEQEKVMKPSIEEKKLT